MLGTIIAFIVIFTVVVVAHEFGHFLLAKNSGIKVKEFSVGMGPLLFKKTKGETDYVIRLLPIAAFIIRGISKNPISLFKKRLTAFSLAALYTVGILPPVLPAS